MTGKVTLEGSLAAKDPRLGWNSADVVAKVRLTDEEAAAMGPAFAKAWDADYKDIPNRPSMLFGFLNG